MQSNPNRDMLVGALVVMGLGVLFAASYGGKDLSAKASVGTYPVQAVFSRVDGLFEGDEVRLGGIRVGTVGAQSLDHHYRAVVTLNLDAELQLPIDSAAAIHTDGLFGSKFVVLEPGVEDDLLSAGGEIQYTQGAMVVNELLNLIIEEGKARQAKANGADAKKANGADAKKEGN
ncbi:MlaD family protein [Pseudomonadota bacterium]